MSPLVTFLVIMLLTVVYNESHYIADYQDDYEKIVPKNMKLFELCEEGSKTKMCKTANIWRELLKNTDELLDDVHDSSRETVHDYIEDGEIQQVGQKRSYRLNVKENCRTTHESRDLRPDHYPSYIGNLTCNFTANEELVANKTWPPGWKCQPIEHIAKVLSRKVKAKDISDDSKGCWLFRRIPMHMFRALSKLTDEVFINGITARYEGCWNFEEIYIHVGCSLKYVGSP